MGISEGRGTSTLTSSRSSVPGRFDTAMRAVVDARIEARAGDTCSEMCSGSEEGSHVRLIDLCITQL